jgi:hypothetical protein
MDHVRLHGPGSTLEKIGAVPFMHNARNDRCFVENDDALCMRVDPANEERNILAFTYEATPLVRSGDILDC